MNKYLSIILNINGLNASIKRDEIAEWIRKDNPYKYILQETHLRTKYLHRLKVKGWKKIFHANDRKQKARAAILISDKIDFKTKAVKRDPAGPFIILKGRIHQEVLTILNIYIPNIGAPKYIRKILEGVTKHIDSNTLTVGDFNTQVSTMDRSSKQINNVYIETLNNTLHYMDLIDIYRNFHPKEAKYTLFSNTHGTLSKIDHMERYKTSLKIFKKIKITSSIFLDHNLFFSRKNLKNIQIHGD